MADAELSLIRFCTMNFWGVLLSSRPMQPISTLLLKLVEALISSEPDPDPEHKKRLRWLFENTHEDINCHLSIVELIVFKNLDKGVSFEVSIGDKDFPLSKLYYILDGINTELSMIVIDIAKKYSMDIPLMNFGSGSGIQRINIDEK